MTKKDDYTNLTWWERFYEENKDNADFDKIFKAIFTAEDRLTESTLNKIIKLVYKLDREKYDEEIKNFDKKIKIFEKRLDRQLSDNFGSIIRHAREKKGFSLTELAKITGISASYINRIELGERKSPSFAIIETLANGLNVPVSELLNISEDKDKKNEIYGIAKLILSQDVAYDDGGKVMQKLEKQQLVDIIEFIIDSDWDKNKHIEAVKLMELIDKFKEYSEKN